MRIAQQRSAEDHTQDAPETFTEPPAIAIALAGAVLAGPASSCGLEGDPVTLQKAAIGYAYPDSLNVMAAVSQARLAGRLDRTISIGVQTPEQLRRTSLRIGAALWQLRARLSSGTPDGMRLRSRSC